MGTRSANALDDHAASRRRFMRQTAAGAFAAAAGSTLFGPLADAIAGEDAKPNILLINVDDLGWKDLSCMGSTYYRTPRIDKLASQGMLFTDAYASAPVSAPSRACLMSGQYTPRHGVLCVWRSDPPPVNEQKIATPTNKTTLDTDVITMAETLKAVGYTTAHIGKWHLGKDNSPTGPKAQGFDINIAGSNKGMPNTYFSPYKMPQLKNGPKGEYLPDRLTSEAIEFMKETSDKPWFLHMSYYTVHCLAAGKLEAKQETIDKYKEKKGEGRQSNPTYAAMVEHMDENVGRLLDALDQFKLTDNTLVIFTSDNGGWGPGTDSRPLRGQKGQIYEGGIRVPLIVRWPGKVKPGSKNSEPTINIDFYPTFCDIADTKLPAESKQPLDGETMTPVLTGKAKAFRRDAIFWHFPAYTKRWPDNTTLQDHFITRPAAAVRMGDWKLIEFLEDNRLELYNLREDPSESKNLVNDKPDKARELHDRMKAWRKAVNAPMPTGPNSKYAPATGKA